MQIFIKVFRIFIFVDFKGEFGALSVFNTSNEIYDKIHEQADIFVVDPLVKEIVLHDNDSVLILFIKKLFVFLLLFFLDLLL